ncbi:MAG: response regulator [Balneolaceae bacterium]
MKQVHILLVEDNEGDIVLTRDALEEGKISNSLFVVRDGEEALEYLEKRGRYRDAENPHLILLDINLPKMNGHEVLVKIKQNPELKHIPVIMLTTSSSESDVMQAYRNYSNCYITKPVDVETFLNLVSSIETFWISIVELPRDGAS